MSMGRANREISPDTHFFESSFRLSSLDENEQNIAAFFQWREKWSATTESVRNRNKNTGEDGRKGECLFERNQLKNREFCSAEGVEGS